MEFEVCMHVHDEVVAEIPESAGPEVEAKFKELMSIVPAYAAGLPMAVETWRGKRYRK